MTVSFEISPEDLQLMDNKRLHRVTITDPNGVTKTWTAYDDNRIKNSNNHKVQKMLRESRTHIAALEERNKILEEQKDHGAQSPDVTEQLKLL